MGNILINPTKNTPYVSFNKSGELIIEGRSYPNDSINFFQPLFDWAESYRNGKITFFIRLEYFNTSTCKQMLSLIKLVADNNEGSNVKVKWFYEENDLDMLEIGQHMQGILNIPFIFNTYSGNENMFS
jgi:hypothetical protein